jgi:hypothetical protein
LRLGDQGILISDDFAIETPASEQPGGRLDELLKNFRDAKVRHRLADVGYGAWAVERWRIPVAITWPSLALAVIVVVALGALCGWIGDSRQAAVAAIVAASVMMILAPFNAWHMRRGAMPLELLRPVTRWRYFLQIAAAVAIDVGVYALLASVLGSSAIYFAYRPSPDVPGRVLVYLACLWSSALLFYGTGLATFRMRYWLPLMIGVLVVWVIGTLLIASNFIVRQAAQPSYAEPVSMLVSAIWFGVVISAVTFVGKGIRGA